MKFLSLVIYFLLMIPKTICPFLGQRAFKQQQWLCHFQASLHSMFCDSFINWNFTTSSKYPQLNGQDSRVFLLNQSQATFTAYEELTPQQVNEIVQIDLFWIPMAGPDLARNGLFAPLVLKWVLFTRGVCLLPFTSCFIHFEKENTTRVENIENEDSNNYSTDHILN